MTDDRMPAPSMGSQNFKLTRRSLLEKMFAVAGAAGISATSSVSGFARQRQQDNLRTIVHPSLSRQFARWTVGLRYEDLPPDVVDRAKGLTLHAIASAL